MAEKTSKKAAMGSGPDFLAGDFDVSKLEEAVLAWWQEEHIFEKSLEQTENGKPFVFYDGPPFATGLPHYGHLLASTMKDLIPRYQTMRGRYVRRRWGWDCHGLPIEELVERKLGISGKKQIEEIGIKKFNETCRSMVLEYADAWEKMVNRIARWVEFKDSYKTMDADFMESVWWGFKQTYDKGLVYGGKRVLLYCPRCETPVSNFEVAMDNSYKDVNEETVTVKFKVKNPESLGVSEDSKIYILAWTTTPWTLPGNVALAVGKDVDYVMWTDVDKDAGTVSYIASVDWFNKSKIQFGAIPVHTDSLIGLEYEPLFDVPAMKSEKSYKVYAADFVKTDEGAGIVHTAVVYGEDDYALGLREGLPVVPMLDERGHFNDKAPEFIRGKFFKAAEKDIKEDLESRSPSLLFKKEMHVHSYPHCWRCGHMLYYNAIPAWFINVQKIKQDLLSSNDREINWFPEHLKHGRYAKSVEAAPDWNISRNRYWGNPIPVWKCTQCEALEAIGGLDELSKKTGGPQNNYWVMRHGEAESNIFDILDSGQRKFLHLTPRGEKQVKAAILKFKKELDARGEKIDIMIASDIVRTHETEDIDATVLTGEKVSLDKHLEEIHLGPTLTGYRDEQYAYAYPTYEVRFEKRPEGGESLRDLRARMWEFLQDCESKYKGKNILIVTHEYPAWMLFHAAEGWSEKRAILEKETNGDDFIGFAEIRKLDVKIIPRNDTGIVDLHRPYIDEISFPCSACGGAMKRTPEIFDSWMEAGSMPFAEYHYPFENKEAFESRFPAQFVVEYIAQTRAWFYVMHVLSFVLFGKAPFENVVTTGTILAEDGSKMSKSKMNYPDPWLVLSKYGADNLRFYLMGSAVMQADNLNFSEKGVEGVYRKVEMLLLNVYKYFATYAFSEVAEVADKKVSESAKTLIFWIEMKTADLVEVVSKDLDAYDTVHATRTIQAYVDDLSTWYLRRSRRRTDMGFFKTLSESLLTVSKVLAPFMPYLAEALYQSLRAKMKDPEKVLSVHLAAWPMAVSSEAYTADSKKDLFDAMAEVRRLASLGLAKRAEVKIKVRQPLAALKTRSEIGKAKNLGLLEILKDEVNVKEIIFDGSLMEDVALDTVITPELREEGLVREVARTIQELRQEAGLEPGDKIALIMQIGEELRNAIMKHEVALKSDVGAASVSYVRSEKFNAEIITKIENQEVWIGIRKI